MLIQYYQNVSEDSCTAMIIIKSHKTYQIPAADINAVSSRCPSSCSAWLNGSSPAPSLILALAILASAVFSARVLRIFCKQQYRMHDKKPLSKIEYFLL